MAQRPAYHPRGARKAASQPPHSKRCERKLYGVRWQRLRSSRRHRFPVSACANQPAATNPQGESGMESAALGDGQRLACHPRGAGKAASQPPHSKRCERELYGVRWHHWQIMPRSHRITLALRNRRKKSVFSPRRARNYTKKRPCSDLWFKSPIHRIFITPTHPGRSMIGQAKSYIGALRFGGRECGACLRRGWVR